MASITREDALATLEDGQSKLDQLLTQLSDEELSKPATMGGGDWSAKDLMCHVARWNELAVEAMEAWRRGEKPAIEDEWDGVDEGEMSGVDRINADNYDRSKDISPDGARLRMREAHAAITGAISGMDNAEWHSKAPYPTQRRGWLGMMMGSITGAPKLAYGHAFAHLPDLQAYVSELRG